MKMIYMKRIILLKQWRKQQIKINQSPPAPHVKTREKNKAKRTPRQSCHSTEKTKQQTGVVYKNQIVRI